MKLESLLQRKSSIWIALLILITIIVIGIGLINKFSTTEHNRDMRNWQYRLSLMADVREDLLNNWIAAQYSTLSTLAKNQSLQLYLSQISAKTNGSNTDIQNAQRAYLRNLIMITASNNGFFEKSPPNTIKANIPVVKHSGIAIVSDSGKVIIATPNMPLLDKLSIAKAQEIAKNKIKGIRDIYLNENSEPVIVFMVPAPTITNSSGKMSATIVGVRTLKNSLYPLLDKEIFSTMTDTSILVRRHQGSVIYLNKENSNNKNRFMRLPRDPSQLAAAYALDNPGILGEKKDYTGNDVVFIGREIQGTNWLLLQMISSQEALKDSETHQQSLITSYSYGLAALVFIILASWRHGASLHAQQYAKVLEEKSLLLTQQRKVLYSITNNIGDLILIVDHNLNIQFSNTPVAAIYQLKPTDIIGKTLTATFGNKVGKKLEQHAFATRDSGENIVSVHKFSFDKEIKIYHSNFLPLGNDDILIVLHDITELKNSEDKNKRLMTNLVHTLTHVIDSYVPDSANHSAKTTKIASAIAKEINLPSADIETLELAACLANIGKLFTPREILLKTTELTIEERLTLQETLSQTTNLLIDLEFDGPVLETIAQKNEYMDGSGYPGGLAGDNILITARILAVANAFVAMHSPRAYRETLSTDEILRQLYEDSGTKYDKHVIATLMHVAENKLDWL